MKYVNQMIIAITLIFSGTISAQVTVNVNVGSPPQWGPVGYTEVRYYYLPDIEAYYDINTSMFIYFGDGIWIHNAYLPSRYSNYDLYYGYKVVMTDYRGDSPYVYFKEYKVKYKKGYRGKEQKTIGHNPGNGNHTNKGNDGGSNQKSEQHSSNNQKNSGNEHQGNVKEHQSSSPKNQQSPSNKPSSQNQKSGGGNSGSGGGKQGGHGGKK